ncbi:aminomethyltransferase family protein [Mesorhizobium australicum]|uniref:aminomethyltransferase family protein n=1 Tax=Mesorhizobium TaxID=68287 RepID=UPI0003D048B2|nr:aminomethyltransferase family protein [Mesorhizobium sp. LNHC209A00]ESY90671.1 hypothetical protein X738_29815 [Mesorhizobium sp. LNHC209A00]
MVVGSYSDMVEELAAIRARVAMGDMSPLSKYVIAGPDAEKLMDTLIPRDIKKLQVGQIYYAPWCDENGHVVGDGLVFRMDETTFPVSAEQSQNIGDGAKQCATIATVMGSAGGISSRSAQGSLQSVLVERRCRRVRQRVPGRHWPLMRRSPR